jgi:long-chain acyl-CoA synthetase
MSDPFSFVPLALGAHGGEVDGTPVAQLVAAGVSLLQRSAPLVRALSGRRAGILMPTSPQFFSALAASAGRGAVLINPLASPIEVAYQIGDAGVGAVFTVRELEDKVPVSVSRVLLDEAPHQARVIIDGQARDLSLTLHEGLTLEGEGDAPGSTDEAVVVYTSAMAGRPLGAILTHGNLLANTRATVTAASLTATDHSLALLPFTHAFGLVVAGMAPLLAGGRVTCMPRFHPVRAVELLESKDITMLVGVPAVFGALLNVLAKRETPLRAPSLRHCICGGAPLPREWQDRWAEMTGVELRQGYGLTEAGPVCLFNRVDRPNARGTMGTPFPGVRVTIRDPATAAELPDETSGEIWVAGDNVGPGYVGGATTGLQRTDGWLRTGDLALRRSDGYLVFTGLLKEMFTRSGFNIYPRELQQAVAELPGVTSVRVIATPSVGRENDIALEVTGSVTEDAVREWCEARLSAYKQPTDIRSRESQVASRTS